MAIQESSLRVGVDSRDMERGARRGEAALDRLGRRAQTTTSQFQRLTSQFSVMRALFASLAVGAAIRTLSSFGQEMSTLQAISGATSTEMVALREEITELGASTRFSATQAAQGATFLARAGFETSEVLDSLSGTLNLAQAGALDLGTAADIASNVLSGFRMEAGASARVADVLAKAANSSNTSVHQLGEALSFVAPVSAGLRVSLEETAAGIGVLSNAGIQASRAGTGLMRVMAELESPTAKTRKILQSLGVSTDEVKITTVGLTAALQRLKNAGADTGIALQIFGQRGGPAFESMSNAIPELQKLTEEFGNAEGFAKEVARIMDDNLNGALLATASATEALVIAFGDLGASNFLKEFFFGLADGVRFVASNLKELTQITLGLAAVFAVVFGKTMVLALTAATRAMAGFTVAMLANPFGAFIAAVTTAAVLLSQFGDQTVEFATDIEEGGVQIATTWQVVKAAVATAFDVLSAGYNQVIELFGDLGSATSDWISITTSGLVDLDGAFDLSFDNVLSTARDWANTLISIGAGAILAVAAGIGSLPDTFQNASNKAANWFIDGMENLANGSIDSINRVAKRINTFLEDVGLDAAAEFFGFSGKIGIIDPIDLDEWRREVGDAAGGAIDAAKKAFESAQDVDWIKAAGLDKAAEDVANTDLGLEQMFRNNLGEIIESDEALASKQEKLEGLRNKLEKLTTDLDTGGLDDVKESMGGVSEEADKAARALEELERAREQFISGLDREFNAIRSRTGEAQQVTREWYADQLEILDGLGLKYEDHATKLEVIFKERLATARQQDLQNATNWRAGIERAVTGFGGGIKTEADVAESAMKSLFSNASSAFDQFLKTGQLDFAAFTAKILADISKIILKMLIMKALKAALGMADGGGVTLSNSGNAFGAAGTLFTSSGDVALPSFAPGGAVSGPGGPRSDSILSWLSDGEFVVNAKATEQFLPLLEAINSRDVPRMRDGGLAIDGAQPRREAPVDRSEDPGNPREGELNVKLVNVLDPRIVGDYVQSEEGERVLINVIRKSGVLDG